MITLLTPTGARPEAFANCVKWMQAQTYQGAVRWVIVDDGPEPEQVPCIDGWEIIIVRPTPLWSGKNTQARNMLAGLDHCTDMIAVIEDDDQYAPWWVERCVEWLQHDDLVGECGAIYRNLRSGNERKMNNKNHASLCQTAVKGEAVEALRQACHADKHIDMALWRSRKGKLYPHQGGVIGLKGYPGRRGIGSGHNL